MFSCLIWYLVDRGGFSQVTLESDEECIRTKKNAPRIRGIWTRSTRRSSAAEFEFEQDQQTGVKGVVIGA